MSKISNSIVIGGPIAVGKTTTIKLLPFLPVWEMNTNDELQNLLLNKMYEGDQIAGQIFQLDMLLTRFDKYKNIANHKTTHIFDRSILEDAFFAKKLFKNDKNAWNYYFALWNEKVQEIINTIGKPQLYILLICSWKIFKERIFNRNNLAEINNFSQNKKRFKYMIKNYETYMINIFKKYKINYFIINTNNLNKQEVVEKINKKISKMEINNEKS